MRKEIVVLGGGCFWCTEAVFKMLRGVISVLPGYAGGKTINPTYHSVCSGDTGHTEVIQIEYDADLISFKDLLTVFFGSHDPTSLNRQGNDIGTQYRSIILYTSENQEKIARDFISEINNSSNEGKPVITEVIPLDEFYVAEDYHNGYYENNKSNQYCELVINPKLKKVQKEFAKLLK
jgi:peptide-methionine (S)-S-oxide reductase